MFVALQVIDCCRSYLALANRSLLLENMMYHASGHPRYQYENASRRIRTIPTAQVKGKSARRQNWHQIQKKLEYMHKAVKELNVERNLMHTRQKNQLLPRCKIIFVSLKSNPEPPQEKSKPT